MRRPPNLMADTPVSPPLASPSPARPAEPAPGSYVELYGLSKPPFGGAADGRGYILFNSHRRAFELIVDHLLHGEGPVLLVGDEGVGKTEMLRAAADVASESGPAVMRLFRPVGRRLPWPEVAAALGAAADAKPEAIRRGMLAPVRRAAVIDDVDLLPPEALAALRALMEPREAAGERAAAEERAPAEGPASAEDRAGAEERAPALVLTASAAPRRAEMNQLLALQRNTVRLIPLSPAEVGQYIERCLWLAGGTTRRLMEADAIRLVAAQSGGVPGRINRLMDAVLTTGFVRGDAMITARTVTAAIGPAAVRPRARPAEREPVGGGVARRAFEIVSVGLFVLGVGMFAYRAVTGGDEAGNRVAGTAPVGTTAVGTAAVGTAAVGTGSDAAALLRQGDEALGMGDVTAARSAFRRAADAGSGLAAVALGKTFDPAYAPPGGGIDPVRAAAWYRRGQALGDPEAARLIVGLGTPGVH